MLCGMTMRRIIVPLCIVLLFSFTASAETYIITGQATYSDNSKVQHQDISIECAASESNCRQWVGVTDQTDKDGNFTIIFQVDSEDEGTEILLRIKGEDSPHIINLGLLESSGGTVTQNIKLDQLPKTPGSGLGTICCILMFAITAVYTVGKTARRLSTPEGRLEFRGMKAAKIVNCPECGVGIAKHLLLAHLIADHDIEMFEAGEMAGKVMRKTWSEEE